MDTQRSAADLSKTSSSQFKRRSTAGISWMMVDRFVFRRDDDDGSFPDRKAAPLRGTSSTSLGRWFKVALRPADPPDVARLYVRWVFGRVPDPVRVQHQDPVRVQHQYPVRVQHQYPDDKVTELLTAHKGLFLLRTTSPPDPLGTPQPPQQDYFVFDAGNSRLKRLPPCTEPIVLPLRGKKKITMKRMFDGDTIGLVRVSSSSSEGFVVVQLAKFADIPGSHSKGAEICVFRSHLQDGDSHDGNVYTGSWEVLTLPIHHSRNELSDLQGFSTDAAIMFNGSICWVDYHRGGFLLYTPPHPAAEGGGVSFISYFQLPIDNRPNNSLPSQYSLKMYRSLCVTGRDSEKLKFVDVARNDAAFYGLIKDGSSFTITCHTFTPSDDEKWHKDAIVTSEELWRPKSHESLIPQNVVTTFPLVSMDKPYLIHFLMSEPRNNIDKVSVVVIDIITKKAVSVKPYIKGENDLYGKHADMVMRWSRLPRSFLPCQF